MSIQTHKLPNGEFTDEGAYYATVNGVNVGEYGRAFWPTRAVARMCAERFVLAQKMQRAMKQSALAREVKK